MPLPILLLRKRKLRHSLGRPSRSDFVHPELHSGEHQQKELISDIINQLLNAEFERQMNDRIRTKLTESGKTLTKNADVLNAAVSKLRVMVKAEKNYENLIAEIEGIEDTKKRELCRSIVKAVNPKTLTEQICRQLEEKYDVGFELRWNENECYRMASATVSQN